MGCLKEELQPSCSLSNSHLTGRLCCHQRCCRCCCCWLAWALQLWCHVLLPWRASAGAGPKSGVVQVAWPLLAQERQVLPARHAQEIGHPHAILLVRCLCTIAHAQGTHPVKAPTHPAHLLLLQQCQHLLHRQLAIPVCICCFDQRLQGGNVCSAGAGAGGWNCFCHWPLSRAPERTYRPGQATKPAGLD